MVAANGKIKSIGPENFSVENLKQVWEAMIPYLARILEIAMNNGTLLTGKEP
jgi:diketogulonate reductase-like aldo/keto reductase